MQSSDYFHYRYLESNGFQRKKCVKCGHHFWTTDSRRKTCNDATCDPYSFIGTPPVKKSMDFREMRKSFIRFFSETHKTVEPYPVIPRWRDDVLLVNASIYDFQPHVTSGLADPPGNPLVMSQPSIRMVDIDNVGKTGRHTTSFEMMCHDAFNTRGKNVYWKEETVEYCNDFLTKSLKIDQDIIVYKEKPWSGGGNGGEALEVFIMGLEVATLVFMDMKIDPEGDYEIEGERYSKMDNRIVDTGYGLERLAWLTDGKESIYESLYPEMLDFIYSKTNEKRPDSAVVSRWTELSSSNPEMNESQLLDLIAKSGIERGRSEEVRNSLVFYRNASIVVDHTRTILLLLNDMAVPSNVKVGYVLRLLIRRTLRSLRNLGLDCDIYDLVEMQRNKFSEICTRYNEKFVKRILQDEVSKNNEILRTGTQIVSRIIEKEGRIDEQTLLRLYDSNGLDPEVVAEIYREKTSQTLKIPDDFHSRVILLHTKIERKEKKHSYPDIDTRPLYYDDVGIKEFTGIVLYSKDGRVILNQTAFYPEGGGQPPDFGYLQKGPKKYNVSFVEKFGKTIVHHVDGDPEVKSRIRGYIDYDRRWQLMIHHSATHLLLAATRDILGPHVWQTGVQKGIDSSRIDVVHYSRITDEEISLIEGRCLKLIEQDRRITVRNIDWNVALEKYGFTLFQGGVPLDSKIRVVEIDGVDAEGCGGTHLHSTGPIGMIKVTGADPLQEGIQRITFVAGPALLRYVQKIHGLVSFARNALKTDTGRLDEAIQGILDENRGLHKALEKEEKLKVQNVIDGADSFTAGGYKVGIFRHSLENEEVKLLTKAVTSLDYDLSVLLDSNAGSTSILSKGNVDSSVLIARLTEGKDAQILTKSKRFSKANKFIELDENLITRILV